MYTNENEQFKIAAGLLNALMYITYNAVDPFFTD